MELSKIEETVFMFDGGIHMHEKVMRENYAKAYKLVVILAAVLALLSAIIIPLSLSQQIKDAAALEQTYGEEHHDGEHDGHDSEDAWKSQITPLTPTLFVIFGVAGLLWLLLLAYYWLLTAAWLYRSAVNEGMNKSLWMILGLVGNLLAVAVFLVVRDAPQRKKVSVKCSRE